MVPLFVEWFGPPPPLQLGAKTGPERTSVLRGPQHADHDVAETNDGECPYLPAVAAARIPYLAGVYKQHYHLTQ